MIPNLTPWTDCLREKPSSLTPKTDWFNAVFKRLDECGFVLDNPQAITGGWALEWKCGDSQVIASRCIQFPDGDMYGIHMCNDTESGQASFNCYFPLSVVYEAIRHLHADKPERADSDHAAEEADHKRKMKREEKL